MKSITPKPSPLEAALNRYQSALNCLDVADISLNKKHILEILSARDTLQKQLEAEVEIPINLRSKLIEQDGRLKNNNYKIISIIDLEEYRESLSISEQAWWWYLDKRESLHPLNRFDGLFKILKLGKIIPILPPVSTIWHYFTNLKEGTPKPNPSTYKL